MMQGKVEEEVCLVNVTIYNFWMSNKKVKGIPFMPLTRDYSTYPLSRIKTPYTVPIEF
jgi:hypothetical protein